MKSGMTLLNRVAVQSPIVSRNYTSQFAVKHIWQTRDNKVIETGTYAHPDIRSDVGVEIATQIGCRLRCIMCASGALKYERNLTSGEMIEQISEAVRLEGIKPEEVSKYFYVATMAIGEPALNAENVSRTMQWVRKNIPGTHINLSTTGIEPEAIRMWADEISDPVNLAISLHAPNPQIRKDVIPGMKHTGLEELFKSLDHFHAKHPYGKKWIVYTPMAGINDSEDNFRELLNGPLFSRRQFLTLKFLMLNRTSCTETKNIAPGDIGQASKWAARAKELGYKDAYVWHADMNVACGQLALDRTSGTLSGGE